MKRRRIKLIPLISLVLSFVISEFAYAVSVNIGVQKINIPSPTGFSEISSISPETVGMLQDMCPPSNRLLAVFLSQEDVGKIMRGDSAQFEQYMTVQSVKKIEGQSFAKYQFAELRKMLRTQYETLYEDQRDSIDTLMNSAGKSLSKRLDEKIDLKIGGVVPLGVDSESASSITMSQLAKYNVSTTGQAIEYIVAGTITALLVNGRVVYLNVYSIYEARSDLEWTRETSKKWIQKILSANSLSTPLAKGQTVLTGVGIDPVVKELLQQGKKKYSIRTHPKAHGLDISIEYPESWSAEEGIRPHIVQKFTGSVRGGIFPMCMVMVQKLPAFAGILMQGEVAREVFSENLHELLPPGATFIDGSQTKIDGEPGAWTKYYYETERAGMKCGMYTLKYILFYEKKMFVLQCIVGGNVNDPEILKDAFNTYLPLFQLVGNSIVIHDKWENPNVQGGDTSSVMSDLFGDYWIITLIFSAILTWGIGLAPPLLIRFAFLRRPLPKRWAIGTVVLFWFINIVIFTALGSTSKTHGALFLVALASYAILRKGAKKQREKIAPSIPNERT